MINRPRLSVLACIVLLGVGANVLAQTSMGDMFQLGRRVGRPNLPSASLTSQGALLYDQDGGTVFVNDGVAWKPLINTVQASTGISTSSDGGFLVNVATAGPSTLSAVLVNAVTVASTTYGGEVLPSTAGFSMTAARFRVSASGIGGTTDANFRASDGTNNCDCAFACNAGTGNKRIACTGTCAFPASASISYSFTSIGDCGTGPTVLGNIAVEGNWQ